MKQCAEFMKYFNRKVYFHAIVFAINRGKVLQKSDSTLL